MKILHLLSTIDPRAGGPTEGVRQSGVDMTSMGHEVEVVTLDDPATWTRPWTFGLPWTEDDSQPIFEYACHEGNYGLRNILSAGRSDDRKGIKSSNNVDAQADLGESEQ